MADNWSDILDSLACQIDMQETALSHGHAAPEDLEIDPPSIPLEGHDRFRAIELFERCELLLDAVTERAVALRGRPVSPYGRTP